LAPQRESELREFLPALGAGVVQHPVDFVDEGLGLGAVGAHAAVDKSLFRQRWFLLNFSAPTKPSAPGLATGVELLALGLLLR
jgi:hypothetical protein